MVVGLAHRQLPPSWQLPSSHERLRALKYSSCRGKKEHPSCLTSSKAPELDGSASPSVSCFHKFIVSREPQVCSSLVPRKGNRNMAPQVPGLFYSTKLQVSITWWKNPHPLRLQESAPMGRAWSQGGVQERPYLSPEPSAPKFVDPQDVDFVIKDLLKGRHIGAYQDLAPGESSSSPDQGFTLLWARASSTSCMPSTDSTRTQSSVKPPTRIFGCSSPWTDRKILC
jgi:hypothetical protein